MKRVVNGVAPPPRETEPVLEGMITDGASIVVVHGFIAGEYYEAAGTAKRDPSDPFDPDVGMLLAAGRAMRAAGRQLIRAGYEQSHALLAERARIEAEKEIYRQQRAAKRPSALEIVALKDKAVRKAVKQAKSGGRSQVKKRAKK